MVANNVTPPFSHISLEQLEAVNEQILGKPCRKTCPSILYTGEGAEKKEKIKERPPYPAPWERFLLFYLFRLSVVKILCSPFSLSFGSQPTASPLLDVPTPRQLLC